MTTKPLILNEDDLVPENLTALIFNIRLVKFTAPNETRAKELGTKSVIVAIDTSALASQTEDEIYIRDLLDKIKKAVIEIVGGEFIAVTDMAEIGNPVEV